MPLTAHRCNSHDERIFRKQFCYLVLLDIRQIHSLAKCMYRMYFIEPPKQTFVNTESAMNPGVHRG